MVLRRETMTKGNGNKMNHSQKKNGNSEDKAIKSHKDNENDYGFESQVKRLEAIVKHMETGNLPLEESLKLFEEGVKISRQCQKELDAAEQKIEKLVQTSTGETEPFHVKSQQSDN